MTLRNFNNSTTIGSLTGPVSSSGTSLTVSGFSGYPAVPFTVTVDRNTATEEICLVTAAASGTLTVTRGFDGTVAQAHSAGAAVEHTAGAIEYQEANAHVNATTGVHGATGSLVSTSATQTVFSKTLISPVLQADSTLGDAVVAYVPSAASTKNLFRGMGTAGTDVITIDAGGNVNAQTLASVGATNVHGALTVTGTSTLTGATTVTGATALNGGGSVPTGKKLTLTDAPGTGTDAANKTYVDGKTWPTTAITDAASAATASVLVKRDAAGRAQFVDPAVAADAATKNYIDTILSLPGLLKIGSASGTTDTNGNMTVTHGFSKTPTAVFIQSTVNGAKEAGTYAVTAITATTFTIRRYYNGVPDASQANTFYYLCI